MVTEVNRVLPGRDNERPPRRMCGWRMPGNTTGPGIDSRTSGNAMWRSPEPRPVVTSHGLAYTTLTDSYKSKKIDPVCARQDGWDRYGSVHASPPFCRGRVRRRRLGRPRADHRPKLPRKGSIGTNGQRGIPGRGAALHSLSRQGCGGTSARRNRCRGHD